MKVFGGYGEYYDQMKLNLAIGSYGGEIWEECWMALMQPTLAGITPAFNSVGSYCIGSGTSPVVNWAGGVGPPFHRQRYSSKAKTIAPIRPPAPLAALQKKEQPLV